MATKQIHVDRVDHHFAAQIDIRCLVLRRGGKRCRYLTRTAIGGGDHGLPVGEPVDVRRSSEVGDVQFLDGSSVEAHMGPREDWQCFEVNDELDLPR